MNITDSSVLLYMFFGISILIFGCRGNSGKINNRLIVTEIIDGNKIKTANGKIYGLIGILPNEDAKTLLSEELLNETIVYYYDSKYSSFSDIVYVYITRVRDKKPINRFVLNMANSVLNTEFLFDSLAVYRNIIVNKEEETDSHANDEDGSIVATDADEDDTENKSNIVEVIKKAEKGVFLVVNQNDVGSTIGTGTGFFINSNGIGLSNYHVFEGGSSWIIRLIGGETFEVNAIIAESKENDFIIFSVDVGDLEMIPLGLGTGNVDKAEEIFVLGNPKGLESILTKGVISSPSKNYRGIDLIQIDAAISSGNSGSPVMKSDGEVVGVATLKFNDCENCNFAINIDDVKRALHLKEVEYNEH